MPLTVTPSTPKATTLTVAIVRRLRQMIAGMDIGNPIAVAIAADAETLVVILSTRPKKRLASLDFGPAKILSKIGSITFDTNTETAETTAAWTGLIDIKALAQRYPTPAAKALFNTVSEASLITAWILTIFILNFRCFVDKKKPPANFAGGFKD